MSKEAPLRMIAKTFHGLENVLAAEVKALGGLEIEIAKRAVRFSGDLKILYKANLYLRTALRILVELTTYEAANEDALYEGAREFPWENIIDLEDSFFVDAVIKSEAFGHSKFAALRVKDGIADRFREKFRRTPNVIVTGADIPVHVFISDTKVQISIDSSGAPLYKRGNRVENTELPAFNEVLAAGMVLLSEWNGEGNFIDPMCGTGTVLIEAGMIAKKIAPGSFREHFGFMNWNYGDSKLWDTLLKEALASENRGNFKLHGSETSKHALTVTRKDLISSKLGGKMSLDNYGFEQMRMPTGGGKVMMIPPVLNHLDPVDVASFYKKLGRNIKEKCEGFETWILSASVEGLKSINLEPTKSMSIWNGRIECKFNAYTL